MWAPILNPAPTSLPIPSSGLSQSTSFECPASCIELALVIYFTYGNRPGCSLEGLMLKLKLQYFGHLIWRVDSLEKTLMLGGIESRKRRGWQRMRWLDGITNQWTCVEWTLGVGDWQGGLRAAIHGVPKSCTWLSNWNELKIFFWIYHSLSEFGKPKAQNLIFPPSYQNLLIIKPLHCKVRWSMGSILLRQIN